MKITDVEVIVVRQDEVKMIGDGSQDTAVVLVHTDEGITGVGEVDSAPEVVKAIVEAPSSHDQCRGLKTILMGEDPTNIEYLWYKMYYYSYYYTRRSVGIHAMSGIDIALWDITGKKYGLPVSKLLGGRFREKIPAYCSVLMPGSKKEIDELVARQKGIIRTFYSSRVIGSDLLFYFRIYNKAKGLAVYVTYSGNCYKSPYYYIGYARACTPETDLTKINFEKYPNDREYRPLVTRNGEESGTGHNSILEEDGRYYLYYHGRDPGTPDGQETRTCRVCELLAQDGTLSVLAR